MDKYKKLATNTIIFAIGTFSSKVLSFLLMPFVTRMMGTADYGAADLVQQTANVLIPIVFLQINSACLRFALDKGSNKADVFTVGIRTTLKGFVVFLLFAYPVSLIKINDFKLGDYIILIYTFVLVSGSRQLCQQFVRGCGKVKIFAVDGIIATATTLAFNLLYLGPLHMGVTGYILAVITSDACSIIFLFTTCKLWQYVKTRNVDKGLKKSMLKYSIPLMPTVILWWIINVSDRYMVTGFIGSSANGLYTAASKIPNFIIMFSSIFIDAWQLSAVDEYDSEGKAEFFTKIFRTYSAGVFTVSSGLILVCQFVTKILVANSYYESWKYVPILIIATTMSCFVSFLGSVYMAEKESVMAMVTAVTGAVANIGLNLILIPKLGAIETSLGGVGAAASTVVAFVIIFVTRTFNTKKYVKINFKAPLIILQTLLLIAQCVVMLILQSGLKMYAIELGLFIVMAILNSKSLIELLNALITKFLKKGRKNNA